MRVIKCGLIGGLGCLTTTICPAGVGVVNPGFEDITGETPFNEFTFGPLNGWDLYDPGAIADGGDGPTFYIGTLTPYQADPVGNPGVYENFPDGAAEGQRVAIAFNFAGSHGIGEYGLQQTLAETLQPNTRYTLHVEVGNIATGVAMSGETFILDGFPGYRIDLLAGDQVLVSDDNLLGGLIPEGEFATSTIEYTTGPDDPRIGESIGIRLVNLNQIDLAFPDSDLEVDFDDVRLVASPVGCPGDIIGDGSVDTADLLALLGCWNPRGPVDPDCTAADLDVSDSVDINDLLIILSNWGECP